MGSPPHASRRGNLATVLNPTKESNNLAAIASEHAGSEEVKHPAMKTWFHSKERESIRWATAHVRIATSQRNTLVLAPHIQEEESNEIHLFGVLRQRQIRWHDRCRKERHVRQMF